MRSEISNATLLFYPDRSPRRRLIALWYFTTLLILWNILGHTVLGFEQSWATPLVAVGTALLAQFGLDLLDAKLSGRSPRFAGGIIPLLNTLPTALIPGLACGMLLYANERLWPVVFATVLAISSKVLFRAPVAPGVTQHFLNPSNFAVAVTLLCLPSVGFAPPYHFTANLGEAGHWIVPGGILITGFLIHSAFTGRLMLVGAWIVGFVLQALVRSFVLGTPLLPPLVPMTSAAFILFTLYMIPDPATTPLRPKRQLLFGFSVAAVYGLLQVLHVVFGLFFALVLVSAARGTSLYLYAWYGRRRPQQISVPLPPAVA
jgi:Na+-translocating ferredoxin:NAD+ oxidoreductase RnfD subunit